MARSQVQVSGSLARPDFNYPKDLTHINAQSQMLESIRNVLEGIADAQPMQCDVACAIKEMRNILKRMDRRLEKHFPLKAKA